MQPQTDGEQPTADRSPCRVLFVSSGDDDAVSLGDRYRIETAAGPESLESVGPNTDCLVVDEETFRLATEGTGSAFPPSVPVVVFSVTADPDVAQAVARREGFDIVYRDTAVATDRSTPEAERLRERIDTACRDRRPAESAESVDDLGDTVLETAGILTSAAPDEVDTKIEWGLGSIAEALGGNRGVLYEHERDRLRVTHEWHASDRGPLEHDGLRAAEFPGFESALAQFEPFRSDETTEDSLARLGYGADGGICIAVPIVIEWTLTRVLVVDGVSADRLDERTDARLRTAGELVGRTLRRNRRRREIERQNDRLERFASVISHDLQNPLNVITGFAELARTSEDPEAIDRIEAAARRMETILEDLRTLTREAAELGELESVSVSTVAERAERAVGTGDVTVEIGDIGCVEADASRLQQAFENLFRNSVEHGSTSSRTRSDDSVEHGSTGTRPEADGAIEHGGPGVTVTVERIDGGFAVSDDGCGFSPEDRGRVFEDGYTGGSGTGLGLAIVRTVVEAHGWAIEAADSPEGGASFEITGVEFDG